MAEKVICTMNSTSSMGSDLYKAIQNRVQFADDDSAIRTLRWLICTTEDKRAAKQTKKGKRSASTGGRLNKETKGAN